MHHPHLNQKINNFSRSNITRALNANIPEGWETMKSVGLYKILFSTACPYTDEIRRVWFYYWQVGDAEPSKPAQASDIDDQVAKGFAMH